MNAEQLWETTMDPEKRNLLKVKVEEMEAADGMDSFGDGAAAMPVGHRRLHGFG